MCAYTHNHTHKYLGVAASDHAMIAFELYGCCKANIEHRTLLFLVFGSPTALLSNVWFMIEELN